MIWFLIKENKQRRANNITCMTWFDNRNLDYTLIQPFHCICQLCFSLHHRRFQLSKQFILEFSLSLWLEQPLSAPKFSNFFINITLQVIHSNLQLRLFQPCIWLIAMMISWWSWIVKFFVAISRECKLPFFVEQNLCLLSFSFCVHLCRVRAYSFPIWGKPPSLPPSLSLSFCASCLLSNMTEVATCEKETEEYVCWNQKRFRSIISRKLITFLIMNCMITTQKENISKNSKNFQKNLKWFRKPLSAHLNYVRIFSLHSKCALNRMCIVHQ